MDFKPSAFWHFKAWGEASIAFACAQAKQLDVLGMEEDAEEAGQHSIIPARVASSCAIDSPQLCRFQASDHEDGSDEEGGRMQDAHVFL